MPKWLCNQIMNAFYMKDRKKIRLLNDCWFYYCRSKNHFSRIHAEKS